MSKQPIRCQVEPGDGATTSQTREMHVYYIPSDMTVNEQMNELIIHFYSIIHSRMIFEAARTLWRWRGRCWRFRWSRRARSRTGIGRGGWRLIKTHLCVYPRALGLHLVAEDERAPRLVYGEAPKGCREQGQVERCGVWLVEMLAVAGEPMRPKDVVKMAEEEGFSRRAVYRAREALGERVVDTVGRQASRNRWALAGEEWCVMRDA